MKPTTESLIMALRDGIATRADLCERFSCDNEALRKPISNLISRGLITRELDGKTVAYYLTAKGRAWRPGMQGAGVRKAVQAVVDSEGGETDIDKAFATAPEMQYLAPEDYAMPEPDAKLLALANRELSDQLANANALIDKLHGLLASKTHECESMRAQSCSGGCKPDMETVPLNELIEHVALFLDEGMSLTIHDTRITTVQAFGTSFVCDPAEAGSILDAASLLARVEVEA